MVARGSRMHTSALIRALSSGLFVVGLAAAATAEITHFEVLERRTVLDGKAFGDVGPYEWITGRAYYAVDPDNPANAAIVDLDLAPRDEDGHVTFHGDVAILRPVDGGSRTALVEVCNRGGKASLRYFNGASSSAAPFGPDDFGDGLLMERGLTVVWVGWQFDVPTDPSRMRLHVPRVPDVTGLVRGRQ
jgi:hypothetical protein